MLTVITPTGARPEAFALCERQMARQTYAGPVRWIVVDDGARETPMGPLAANWTRIVLRPDPAWRPGENTQGRNLRAALAALGAPAPAARIVFVEDDDFYAEDWLARAAAALETADLIGEAPSRWYNARTAAFGVERNTQHASLRCTGIKGQGIEAFAAAIETDRRYYDLDLWRRLPGRLLESISTVGVKGLPGRDGVTAWHHTAAGRIDHDGAVARRWFGGMAAAYAKFREQDPMSDLVECIVRKPFHTYAAGEVIRLPNKQVKMLKALGKVGDAPVSGEFTLADAPPREIQPRRSRKGGRKAASIPAEDSVVEEIDNIEDAEPRTAEGLGAQAGDATPSERDE